MRKLGIIAAAICAVILMASCDPPRPPRGSGSASDVSSVSSVSSVEKSQTASSQAESSASSSSSQDSDTSEKSSETSELIQAPVCSSAILYCVEDGKVLYNDSVDYQTAPASITKLLTASVALKYLSPDDVVTVGTELDLVNFGSSLCYIDYGNKLTVKDLLTGMLLNSGNDAAYTTAVCTARAAYPNEQLSDREAVSKFVDMMNSLAGEIGMSSSHFMNPDGWDEDGHYVTVSDLAKLSEYSLKNDVIREIVGTFKKDVVIASGESLSWKNTNSLLDPGSIYYCDNAIGLKTGTTDNAGYCLSAACTKNGKTYITVVTGCQNDNDRFELTIRLFSLIK